jgi:hypothetical protein
MSTELNEAAILERYAIESLSGADFDDADLSGANLEGADLSDADLSGADLSGADLTGADLSGAKLNHADLRDAELKGANLIGADLDKADLGGANLSGADLRDADLSGVRLYGANLDWVQGLSSKQEEMRIAKRVLAILECTQGSVSMSKWHTCATVHCLAGWICMDDEYPGKKASRLCPTLAQYFYQLTATHEEMVQVLQRVASGEESVWNKVNGEVEK